MSDVCQQFILAARPDGLPKESDFALRESPLPELADGQVRVRTCYLSVDPYMRGLMAGAAMPYSPAYPPGEVVLGGAVGRVEQSRSDRFQSGDVVVGNWGWRTHAVVDAATVEPVDTSLGPMSTALGVLGMPGLTAYFGLLAVGELRGAGQQAFISGAAGAVGSLAGQIARIKGARVAGSAGSAAKVEYLLGECGFDAAFNYKEKTNLRRAVRDACPNGVDVYFDNVGGAITDAVLMRINTGARVVLCGQIDQYNATEPPVGPRMLWMLIVREARAEGFLVFHFRERFAEARREIAAWIKRGRVTYRETIRDGFASTPAAFRGLFTGENIGKQLVRVSDEAR
jgi:NADPH-dependent curcumin reductase CurA